MLETQEKNNFLNWLSNYQVISSYDLIGEKRFLGSEHEKKCRFCGKKEPEISFISEAHVVSLFLGNKSLFSYYECDKCNEYFGSYHENYLNNALTTFRIVSSMPGRKGTFTTLNTSNDSVEKVMEDGSLHIVEKLSSPSVKQVDDHTIELTTEQPETIPIYAFKALIKYAVSIVPESYISDFKETIDWLKYDKEFAAFDNYGKNVFLNFYPGPKPFSYPKIELYRIKDTSVSSFSYMCVLAFNNFLFQFFIPCSLDKRLDKKEINIHRFIMPSLFMDCEPEYSRWDLSSHIKTEKELLKSELHFDNYTKKTIDSSTNK